MGADQTALGYAQRAVSIHRATGYDYRTATALNRQGHALLGLGKLDQATKIHQEALDLRRRLDQSHSV